MTRHCRPTRISQARSPVPALQAVITFKWNTFARRLLLVELGFFMLWLVGFNTFTILFQVRQELALSSWVLLVLC